MTYGFTDAPGRDGESVGLDVAGRAVLVPGEMLGAVVQQIEDTYGVDPR